MVALVVLIGGGAVGGSKALDALAKSRMKAAASDLGIDLIAESASYALLDLPNDGDMKAPDLVLRGVTLRIRGDGASLRAKRVAITMVKPYDKGSDKRVWTRVELFEPTIEMEGSAKVIVAGARLLLERADAARASTPLSVVLHEGSATVRGIAGPASEIKLHFSRFAHDVGTPHERVPAGEGDFTWTTGSESDGPHVFALNTGTHDVREKQELRLTCGAPIVAQWADDAPAALSVPESTDCPSAVDLLTTTLGLGR
jgi:hypothetical protein